MNFFGHAVAAWWHGGAAEFALGAMLPDWAGMCGARLGPRDGVLAAGIAFHHATDDAFHRLDGFRALERDAIAMLERRGLERGPARGAAHVAVELMLDGALLGREPAADALYLAALERAPRHAEEPGLTALVARLVGQGLPLAYREPREVARRTTWALARRPRLALDAAAQAGLVAEAPALAARVAAAADGVMAELWRALGPAGRRLSDG